MSADGAGHLEQELKLGADPAFVVPDLSAALAGGRVEELPALDLDATYHDTDDLQLVRNGASLRRRTGEGATRWTLKLPVPATGPALSRREIEVEDDSVEVPGRLADLVTGWVRGAELAPVVVIRTHRARTGLLDADGAEVAELDDDSVTVVQGDEVVGRFREVEVELTGSGTPELLASVGDLLVAAGAGEPDATSKVARALGARAEVPTEPAPPELVPSSTLVELARAALAEPARRLVDVDAVLRLEPDADAVRHARSAVRRLRTHLTLLDPVLVEGRAGTLRDHVRELGDLLAAVRHHDVVVTRLLRSVGALPAEVRPAAVAVVGRLDAPRASATADLQRALRAPAHVELLRAVVAVATDPGLTVDGSASAAARLPELVAPFWHRAHHDIGGLGHHPDAAALVAARSTVRRARDAASLAAPVVGEPAALLARGLGELHDVIGVVAHAGRASSWLEQELGDLDDAGRRAADELLELQRADIAAAVDRWRDSWDVCRSDAATGWLR